ncbi:MAG: hypothetical protein AB7S26_21570 [Sandaracinaceae bacterium]
MRLQPEWDSIDPLRHYTLLHATQHFGKDTGARVALVAHELLENAVKYGMPGVDIQLEVRFPTSGHGFEVRVSNEAVASRGELLRRELERLMSMEAAPAYIDAIRRTRRLVTGSCGIGLARIRSEVGVELSVENEGARLTVVASTD